MKKNKYESMILSNIENYAHNDSPLKSKKNPVLEKSFHKIFKNAPDFKKDDPVELYNWAKLVIDTTFDID